MMGGFTLHQYDTFYKTKAWFNNYVRKLMS